VCANAAAALQNLAVIADNQVSIAWEGAVEPLIALLKNGSDEGKTKAAGALQNLAINAESKAKVRESLSSIEEAYKAATSDSTAKSEMRKLLRRLA
jgi:hypothetical protein